MKSKHTNADQISQKDIATSLALVTKASAFFAGVDRMSPTDKQRTAKMRSSARAVIPTLANVATKFALEVPGMSAADMTSNVAYADSLEPLISAVSAFLETLRDEHLRANSAAWTTATATWAVLKGGARANRNITNELAAVKAFFRTSRRGASAADGSTSTPGVTGAASSMTKPTGTTNGASVTSASAAPVSPVSAASVNGAAS